MKLKVVASQERIFIDSMINLYRNFLMQRFPEQNSAFGNSIDNINTTLINEIELFLDREKWFKEEKL
jgi:hypothetical protein